MTPKYTVIIPVYKAEKTLRKCVDSLLKYKRDDVEVILVNDGSPDSSGKICEEYAKEYSYVRYISKENGGVSTARNAGLTAASGTYITFVDSDDYVVDDYFAIIDNVISQFDYDLVQFSHYVTGSARENIVTQAEFSAFDRASAFSRLIGVICNKAINPPWAKVYKREIIEKYGISFPIGASVAEDRAFNIAYSTHIDSYRVSETPVYYVSTENDNSLSRKKHIDLESQFAITGAYARNAIKNADIPESEKTQYMAALNFGTCRVVYKNAKDLHREKVPFFKRLQTIHMLCRKINKEHYKYPKTRYCTLISLPVRLNLALLIDVMAWKLTH